MLLVKYLRVTYQTGATYSVPIYGLLVKRGITWKNLPETNIFIFPIVSDEENKLHNSDSWAQCYELFTTVIYKC